MVFDLIIIGAGPAGITAAIYAARRKINFLVISLDIGGQTIMSSDVENYPGMHYISGIELVNKFKEHMKDYNIKIKNEEVIDMIKNKKFFKVITNNNVYNTKAIIIASGKKPQKLNIPGEEKFTNKGVSYCAVCDAPLFKGKVVAVIGGGDSALEAAAYLEKYAKKAYIININPKLSGETIILDKVKKSKKINVINNANTTEILGNKFVTKLNYIQNKKQKQLNVEGIFVEIGLVPRSEFAKIVKKNKWKEVTIFRSTKTMEENLTNVKGIFAAGDVTDIPAKQIITAAGEGCKAALAAFDYLDKLR